MRKMCSLIAAAFLLIIGNLGANACQHSDFNLVSETDL